MKNAVYNDGLEVAIIEKDKIGGTCLNRGCVPSKLLIHSADISEIIKSAHAFGIKIDRFSIDSAYSHDIQQPGAKDGV